MRRWLWLSLLMLTAMPASAQTVITIPPSQFGLPAVTIGGGGGGGGIVPTTCTNQFVRAIAADGTATCASVVNADIDAAAAIAWSKMASTGTIPSAVQDNITRVGTLVAGAVPASLVTAGTFGAGNYGITGYLELGTGTKPSSGALRLPNGSAGYLYGRGSSVDVMMIGVVGNGVNIGLGADVSIAGAIDGASIGSIGGMTSVTSNAFRLARTAWSSTAPSGPVACTSPSVTWSNGTAVFQIDVGTSCTGVTTLVVTLPSTTNAYGCRADNVSAPTTRQPAATAWSTTSVTFTNFDRTTGVAADWADGADVRITCTAG